MNFKISKKGLDLIKHFEGCYLKAYLCPAKVWTIGWGTTGSIDGVPIGAGMTITQAKADSLLVERLVSYENAVKRYVTHPINQNQFDALTSFTYNCGPGALQKSDLLKLLNQGKIQQAANEFDRWNRGGGQVLAGLVRRRAAERDLFLKEWEAEEVEKEIKINLNGVVKAVTAIEKNGHNYVKLQDLRDSEITIGYDAANKLPIVAVKK
jgi:GH24 family phage-related lysozyme (muramidase)